MDRRNKNILIISITFLVLLIIGGAYWYFSKKVVPTVPTPAFPGGAGAITGGAGGEGLPEEQPFIPGSGAPLPRLYELHKVPVAGAGFIETGKGADHTVSARYIERGLGHIYETPLATLMESRISNETHSGLTEALWGNGGKSVVIRFIGDSDFGVVIKSSILNLGDTISSFARSTSTESISEFTKTEEVFLPDYIPFMATAEDGADKLFYLENGISASAGSITSFKNTLNSKIFSSSFTEWLPQFPSQKLVTLTSKPSANVPGHLFFIDPKTKASTKVLGGINGLTTLTSHDGKFVLYSETRSNKPGLSLYDTVKKETRILPLQTLPEKCVWSFKNVALIYCAVPQAIPGGTYPDEWYQGTVSFSDAVWLIDASTGLTQKVMTPSDYNAPSLDIINPTISSDDYHLLFMNKVTGTPWVYRTVEVIPPWVEPVAPKAATKKR